MNYGVVKSTRATASADIKALTAGPAHIHQIIVQNNGTGGVAGAVEIRDAQTPAGDTGTLRYDMRFGSTDEDAAGTPLRSVVFPTPLYMPNGIRLTLNTVTNVIVWIFWEG